MSTYKIGIIGAGSIVENNHVPAIKASGGAIISWIYDKNPQRAELVSKMYGILALSGEWENEWLEQVDTCLLATPYGTRPPYIDACRKAGKALVVEKPFAFSREEHFRHCEGFRPWRIAVNFQRRYYRSVASLRKIIRQQVFGRLNAVRFVQGNFTLKGGAGYLSSAQLAGGGVIAESASHILDIILMITGAENVELSQLRSLRREGLDYDTNFESEITAADTTISVSCEISTLRNLENGLYLEFDDALVSCDLSPDGTIFVRDRASRTIEFALNDASLHQTSRLQASAVSQAFGIFWKQFLNGLDRQEPNQTSATSSLITSAWIGQIYKKINTV
jgi:predicted dehydrogenase